MSVKFLESLEKREPNYNAIFNKLHTGVINTNALIGQDVDKLSEDEINALKVTYKSLLTEELSEVQEAIDNKDKVNLLGELIDVLVVGGFLYYLQHRKPYTYEYSYSGVVCAFDIMLKGNSVNTNLHYAQAILQQMDCDVELAVDEILKANLSKFATPYDLMAYYDTSLADAISMQIIDLEKGGRYSGVTCEEVVDSNGDTYLIFWSSEEFGKVKRKYLKANTFSKADLTDCFK